MRVIGFVPASRTGVSSRLSPCDLNGPVVKVTYNSQTGNVCQRSKMFCLHYAEVGVKVTIEFKDLCPIP